MLTAILLLVAGVGTALLRFGWDAKAPAQVRLTLAGWAAIVASIGALTVTDGAWGAAMGTLPVMLVAFVLVGREALTSTVPARTARISDAPPTVRLHATDWRDVGRRVAIFLLSVPVAGIVSLLAGLAIAAVARASGADASNTIVLALAITPVVWTVLGVVLLLEARVRAMLRPLVAIGAVSGATFWLLG